MIEKLESKHLNLLIDFFLSLNNNTYYFWNRFGKLNNKEKAEKIAIKQVELLEKEEVGFVYIEDNKIYGYSYLRFFSDKLDKKYTTSLGIVVTDKKQNSGIGYKLMQYMIDYAKTRNYKKIWLATYTDNRIALHLYNKLGFEIEGIFMYDEYYNSKPRHVVSMAKFLTEDCSDSIEKRNKIIKELQKC